MPKGLTNKGDLRRNRIMQCINYYMQSDRIPPTIRMICADLDMATSVAYYHMHVLYNLGKLTKCRGKYIPAKVV